jgi:tetratricopeptide (TPR) repeat protein
MSAMMDRRFSGWRLGLFRLATLCVVPAALFLLAEIALRTVGYGFPTTIAVKSRLNGAAVYYENAMFGWRFFPRQIARKSDPFMFAMPKPANTVRIFILGSSAAQGEPDGAFSFSRMLQVMLREAYPGVGFEMINTAMPAINSHAVRLIARECVRYQPDLLIVYTGNNEIVGPYGAGTVFAPLSSSLALIRLDLALKRTRVGQGLLQVLGPLVSAIRKGPRVWHGLEMFRAHTVAAGDPRLRAVYHHFRHNLRDVVQAAEVARVPLIVGTVGCNLKDCPPFASRHRLDLTRPEEDRWNDLYRQAIAAEEAGRYAQAAAGYRTAAAIDDRYANLHFRIGRCAAKAGDDQAAYAHFALARDLDALRFRADSEINAIIRAEAGDRDRAGVRLVDVERALAAESPQGVPGQELFYEHVHFNFHGNYSAARILLPEVEALLPTWVKARPRAAAGPVSEAVCARCLAWTAWEQCEDLDNLCAVLLKRPPFTGQLEHDGQMGALEGTIGSMRSALTPERLLGIGRQYEEAIAAAPSDWWLRWKYADFIVNARQDNQGALAHYQAVRERLPFCATINARLGLLMCELGRPDEAIPLSRAALRLQPGHPDGLFNLGLAWQLKSEAAQAASYYRKAIRVRPEQGAAYNNLAAILLQRGRTNAAVRVMRQGVGAMPDEAELHINLAVLLGMQNHRDEAIRELQAALAIEPGSARARGILERIRGR